ncbi:MAG: hypothetical protein Q9167_002745 [Letrouitia subvulpina]
MSRRGYVSNEIYEERERERDYYAPRPSGGRTTEEIDIRERRRREPDFLREDYGRNSAGPLVVREEKLERESEFRPRPRDRPREVEERDIIVSRGPRERDRLSDREINHEREELVYRTRESERPRQREINIERDDIVYQPRPREPQPQQVRRVREDWEYRSRPREPSYEKETIDIRERERERPRERDFQNEEIIIRRSSVSRERERPRERDVREEDIILRRGEVQRDRPRGRDRGYEEDELIIRRDERERDRPRTRASSFDRETLKIRVDDREPRRARSRADFREEDISIRREERGKPRARSRDFREEDLIIQRRERSRDTAATRRRSRSRSRSREDITIRHDDRGGRHRDEIIIRRDEKSPSPEPYVPPPQPEPIRAPPIHQEIITHHRHIDHGFENRAPAPLPPPRPRSPSPPKSTFDEIEIRRRSSHNGRRREEDLIISERDDRRRERSRRRSVSRNRTVYSSRDEIDIAEEAEYYNSRANERGYIGEGYNGHTRDWAIVDVPPGTKRVQMEGVGGAKEEVTWQRYNGVRRSKFVTEDEEYRGGGELMAPRDIEGLDRGRRFVGEKDKRDKMWTEITKDLVTKDAIEEMGYDYEETEFFYYIMVYMRYEDVQHLVDLSEDIKRDRRDRIREIEWEQRQAPPKPRLALPGRPWDEERIIEREVVYEGPPPPRRYR